jgi:guanylate kinase
LYDSRAPRPGEVDGVDYHFRSRSFIEGLREKKDYSVFEVRADLQALDVRELKERLERSDVFFEGNPFIGCGLLTFVAENKVECLSVFLSPLSQEEVTYLTAPERGVSLPDFLTDVMRRKLLRRTTKQKGILSLKDLENIEIRARSAYQELKQGWRFDAVIPNHDGEDSENWDAFYYPVGDARKALLSFAALLENQTSRHTEKWGPELVP